jgi:hypothetical protein
VYQGPSSSSHCHPRDIEMRAVLANTQRAVCVCVITCCFRASSAVLAVVSSSSRAQTKSNDVVVVGSRDGDAGALPRERCIEREREREKGVVFDLLMTN